MSDPDFFVGYLPMPRALRRFALIAGLSLCVLVLGAGFVLARSTTGGGRAQFRGRTEEELREGCDPDAFQRAQRRLAQSTSCMMWSATHTSSPCWFLTSTFELMRSRSRSSELMT